MKMSSNLFKTINSKYLYVILLLVFLRIDLGFLSTLPTGGDMGAHIVPTNYFVENFFSNFQLRGWSNDWFAGYPLYYFYFPLPPLITSLLNLVFPFSIAFKLMVISTQILLVFSVESLFRKETSTFSTFGFSAGLLFLLTESFTIFGGNLASSLAGQYSYTLSIAFCNFSIYFLIKSQSKLSVLISAICIGFSLLSHLIPFLIFSPIYVFYFLKHKSVFRDKSIAFLVFIFLTLDFSFSLFSNLEFTTNMTYAPYSRFSDLIKIDILPFVLIAFVFLISSNVIETLKHNLTPIYLIIVSLILFFYGPESALWNGRLVPFFNLGIIVFFFSKSAELIEKNFKNYGNNLNLAIQIPAIIFLFYKYVDKWSEYYLENTWVLVVLLSLVLITTMKNKTNMTPSFLIVLIIGTVSYLPHWVNWNFTGYENKSSWGDIENLYNALDSLPPGRIMWEPNSELNKYGTPMVLMTIPMFTNHTSMEGLYFDSSITTPFHFIAVSGLAERPSNPVGGLSYINGNFEKGIRMMDDLGIDYFIAYTEKIKEKADGAKELVLLSETDVFKIYAIKTQKVELITDNLLIFESPNFTSRLSSSLIKDFNEESFFELAVENFVNESNFTVIENLDFTSYNKYEYANLIISDLTIQNNEISFTTNKVNYLHLIKVSYFPNWKIKDGYGPFRVSPSFMAVIPTSPDVKIVFEKSQLENILDITSILSLGLASILLRKKYKNNA